MLVEICLIALLIFQRKIPSPLLNALGHSLLNKEVTFQKATIRPQIATLFIMGRGGGVQMLVFIVFFQKDIDFCQVFQAILYCSNNIVITLKWFLITA